MKRLFILLLMLLPLMSTAQRTIENPVCATKSMGTIKLGIEKIVLTSDTTKLFMFYTHPGSFNMNRECRIIANGKSLPVVSSEGIELSGPYLDGEGADKTHFVLNFPPVDSDVEYIDFIEDYCQQCFQIYEIALTDEAASKIKNRKTMPEGIKEFATSIKDNGKPLDNQEFTLDSASLVIHFYGFDSRMLGGAKEIEVNMYVSDPFTRNQAVFRVPFKNNEPSVFKIPVVTKYTTVQVACGRMFSFDVLLTAGTSTDAYIDFGELSLFSFVRGEQSLKPYYTGDNADLNYALSLKPYSDLYERIIRDKESAKKISGFDAAQYKKYILGFYDEYAQKINALQVTKRAKELLTIILKNEISRFLYMGDYYKDDCYYMTYGDNNPSAPAFKRFKYDKEYVNYPKLFELDNINMFYADRFSYSISGWDINYNKVFHYYQWSPHCFQFWGDSWNHLSKIVKLSKSEKALAASIGNKERNRDTAFTADEKAFQAKYEETVWEYQDKKLAEYAQGEDEYFVELFGNGNSYFKDFPKLQQICRVYENNKLVSDSLVQIVEQMSNPFYAKYIKYRNAEINAKNEAEKLRGGYFAHKDGESKADSILVEIVKDHKGKVVFIDLWNTWCGPCRMASKAMAPIEASYEGKDVVFVFVADDSSPLNEWEEAKPTMKGIHYRFTSSQKQTLMDKWGLNGIPSFVLIGKDGMVKLIESGFGGTDVFKNAIDEELSK